MLINWNVKLPRLLFYLQCIHTCSGCNKNSNSNSNVRQHYSPDPDGVYSFDTKETRLCSSRIPDTMEPLDDFTNFGEAKCLLPPGLQILAKGYIKTMNNEMGDVVTRFQCMENLTTQLNGQSYNVPIGSQIKPRLVVGQQVYEVTRESLSKDLLKGNAFPQHDGDIRLRFLQNEMLKHGTDSLKIFRFEKQTYEVEFTKQTPQKALMFHYRSLPNNFSTNPEAYDSFIRRYGTHVVRKAIFGSFIEISCVRSCDDLGNNILSDTLNNIKLKRNDINIISSTKILPAYVTDFNDETRVNCTPLGIELVPMYDFIDKNKESPKYQSLKSMILLREQKRALQNLVLALELNPKHKLSTFLINAARKDQDQLCPNMAMKDAVDEGIIHFNNYNLTRYSVTCTHDKWYWPSKNSYYIITRNFIMLPGVCFTKDCAFSTCMYPNFSLPPGVPCMQFFNERSCSGIPFAKAYTATELSEPMINSKSFSF